MLQKNLGLALIVLIFGTFSLRAQDRLQGKKYILADVAVTGKVTFNEQTVVTFTGLQKGQQIQVPGEQISNAIKKLGKLGLFSDIDFYVDRVSNDSIWLELNINELPKLSDVKLTGVKKGKMDDLLKETGLTKGKVVNENLITTTKNYIENKYKKDGFYSTKVNINTIADTSAGNMVKMVVAVDRGSKIKIADIDFEGNTVYTDGRLKRKMGTKERSFFRVWKASKFIPEKYKEDLVAVTDLYKENGYRDARIVHDSVGYNQKDKDIEIKIKLEEGRKYYFGNIKFLGNAVYSDQMLQRMLGIKKGDTYNGVMLEKRVADPNPEAESIKNLYENNGYLFSSVNAVETRTYNDTIDFEIRVIEGPIAYFNKIAVKGNDRTNDGVIYRELRTKPGQKYSKEDIMRTMRELGALGFFDPEAIRPDLKNVDPTSGTVDVDWNLVEKGSSQVELQGGYGGGGFIGTLGLSFNNFSMRNIFKKDAYHPLPMGDGQKVSLRLQGSSYFQTYSASFSEPWFGGKKPIQFSASISHSKQFLANYSGGSANVDRDKSFNITSVSVGLQKRLSVPDDNFYISHALSFQYYDLNNYNTGLFTFGDGSSRNLAYTFGILRNNKGTNPIYPMYGSEFSLTAKLTPPYSLFNNIDYRNLKNQDEYKLTNKTGGGYFDSNNVWVQEGAYIDANGNRVASADLAAVDQSKVDQKKFDWLEYYKIKFKADWYTKIYDKLVLRTLGEFGFLGAYNNQRGLVPFERFFLGGDGLANFSMDGREVIQLRGYPNYSLSSTDGGTIYNKFSMELRYPISLAQTASIYVLGFAEGGASYDNFKEYNPFVLQRSAGFGLRVFMPAFGLLGIDFGHGFDAIPGQTGRNGWETHFIIGQQF